MKWVRSGCLLKTQNNHTFSFLHKSLVEYFAVNDLIKSVLSFNCGDLIDLSQEELQLDQGQFARLREFSFNEQSITKSPDLLLWLAERSQEDESFKEHLMDFLERSKAYQGHLIEIAAANAITILNRSGVEFTRQNLSGVRIPGADLSHNDLTGVDLSYANLKGVNFSRAMLFDAQLTGACLQEVRFGERPYIPLFGADTCAYSADGQFLAVGNWRGYVVIYDAESKVKQATLKAGVKFYYSNRVTSLAFGPKNKREGGKCKTLAVGSMDGVIRIFCTEQWKEKGVLKVDKGECINCVAYNLTGTKIIFTTHRRIVREWDMISDECHQLKVRIFSRFTYDPTGLRIAFGDDKTVRIWDVERRECIQTFSGHKGFVTSVAYDPTGLKVISSSEDNTIREWLVETGECLQVFYGHAGSVTNLTYDRTGLKIASISNDGTVREWAVKSGECLQVFSGQVKTDRMGMFFDFIDETKYTHSIFYDLTGTKIISASTDFVREWEVAISQSQQMSFEDRYPVKKILFDSTSSKILSRCSDGILNEWLVETGEFTPTSSTLKYNSSLEAYDPIKLKNVFMGYIRRMGIEKYSELLQIFLDRNISSYKVVYDPTGSKVAFSIDRVSDDPCAIGEWNGSTGEFRQMVIPLARVEAFSMAYHPTEPKIAYIAFNCNKHYFSSSDQIIVGEWQPNSSTEKVFYKERTYEFRLYIVYDPTGSKIAFTNHCFLKILDSETGSLLNTFNHYHPIKKIAFDSRGLRVASGGGKAVRIWDVESGACLQVIDFSNDINNLAFSELGDLAVASGNRLSLFFLNQDGLYQARWHCPRSNALGIKGCEIEGAVGLSEMNRKLLEQGGSTGAPLPFEDLRFNEIYHNLPAIYYPDIKPENIDLPSIKSQIQPRVRISTDRWYVYLICKSNHAFLLIEGVQGGKCQVVRAELRIDIQDQREDSGQAQTKISLKTLDSLNQLVEDAIQDYVCQSWQIDSESGRHLIRSIDRDRYRKIDYNLLGGKFTLFSSKKHNCLTWCEEKLEEIEIYPTKNWLPIPDWLINAQNHQDNQESQNSKIEGRSTCSLM